MRWLSRRRFNGWLVRSPLLRLLVYEVWFRRACAGFAALILFLALFLPRIWVVSPSGLVPVIRVSGLDLAQAWSLKRSAAQAMAAGRFEEANYAWLAALANNRADAELVRGALRNLLLAEPNHGVLVRQHSSWLLRLSRTNAADLELVVKLFERYEEHERLAGLLEPRKDRLSLRLEASHLKALFNSGRFRAFVARWEQKRNLLAHDGELALYGAACSAGWEAQGPGSEGMRRLEAAFEEPGRRVLAARLLLAVSAHRLATERYERMLASLEERGAARFSDHLGFWRTLAQTGNKSDAIRLAQEFPQSPACAEEVTQLAQFYAELGSRDLALQVLSRSCQAFGDSPLLWITYAHLLIEARAWEELRRVAVQMRASHRVRDYLAAFSFYLEGRAELSLKRSFLAALAFQRMTDWEFHPACLGLSASSYLLQSGYAEVALKILLKLEDELSADPQYWVALFKVAAELKREELMLSASNRARQLRPRDPMVQNDYAASLLIQRRQPAEAIKVTFPIFSQNRGSPVAAINHAAALLANQRPREAAALLRSVPTNRLSRAQTALYQFDLFEACFNLGQFDEALRVCNRIERQYLFPTQLQWLEQARRHAPILSPSGLSARLNGGVGFPLSAKWPQ